MARRRREALLRPDALRGVQIAVSVSESEDLARLGLVETHFRLALGELARSVLVSGGKLAYGGRIHPEGYTAMLMKELQRYNRRDRPLSICLAWQEHRELSKGELQKQIDELGLLGEIICLDAEGRPVPWDDRANAPVPETDAKVRRQALSGLRRYMAQHANGRVIIGGKRSNFEGEMPGVLEEAIASVEMRQPLYVVGGFGGISADVAVRIGFLNADWLPQMYRAVDIDNRALGALDHLLDLRREGWPDNGLSDGENAQLATTYRPSEIAALISLGLGRRFGDRSRPTSTQPAQGKRSPVKRPRKSN
ncbi:hypothetical protein ABIB90_001542 [Bradyrhizobium sp. JR4.1]|uniref:hypothetical protein n=1 Tax=Bradyrhizobium sp. JR4.1 TaxID=3156372 RepID=UPI0033922FCE